MAPHVVALVLLSATLHASWNALAKSGGDPVLRLALVAAGSSLCAVPLLPLVGTPDAASWPFLVGSTLLHQAYYAFLALAYREGDLSVVYPVARGTAPLFVAAGGWALAGEALDPVGVAAVLVVCAGLLALNTRAELRCCRGRPATFAVLTALAIAGYGVSDGLGGRVSGDVVGYAVHLTALQGLPVAAVVLWSRRGRLRRDLAAHGRGGLLAGALSALAYAIVIWAMARAPLGFVAALREVSVVVAALLGARVLGEPVGGRRLGAAALVAAGIVLLQFGGVG